MRFMFDSFHQNWALPWQNLKFSSLNPQSFLSCDERTTEASTALSAARSNKSFY